MKGMRLKAEDGWDYLDDGVYWRRTSWGSVQLASYDGLKVLDFIELEEQALRKLITKIEVGK